MTINLAARGLATTMTARTDQRLSMLLASREPATDLLDTMLTELPDEAIAKVKRVNGRESILLVNGTRLALGRINRSGQHHNPSILIVTHDAAREMTLLQRDTVFTPLLAMGAQLATF